MFNYEAFDEIFSQFKNECEKNVSEIIDMNQKYVADR